MTANSITVLSEELAAARLEAALAAKKAEVAELSLKCAKCQASAVSTGQASDINEWLSCLDCLDYAKSKVKSLEELICMAKPQPREPQIVCES